MWSIKQRRTKPRTVGNKVIYPKFNATSKPNRYVNRNTYLDVKCNRDKGAGCTIVGCQCSKKIYYNFQEPLSNQINFIDNFNLKKAVSVAVSPDGKNVYATAQGYASLVTFARDPLGVLTMGSGLTAPILNGNLSYVRGVTVSPDGKNVYAVAGPGAHQIVPFTRDETNGALTMGTPIQDTLSLYDAYGVIVSPDGKNVYTVALGTVGGSNYGYLDTFARNLSTGVLTMGSGPTAPITNSTYLWRPIGLAISSDGKNVYAVAENSNSIVTFARDETTGALTMVANIIDATNLWTVQSVTVSPDGKNVYAVAKDAESIVTFARNLSTGVLTMGSGPTAPIKDPTNLNWAIDVIVSPDGKSVYAVAYTSDSIVHWDRNTDTGALTNQFNLIDNTNLDGVDSVAISPDGKNVYAVAQGTNPNWTGYLVYWDTRQSSTIFLPCCKTTPYRNPILGYRKHLVDCSGNTDTSGCRYTNDVSGNVYKDNYAKSCCDPSNSLVCYNPVIKRTQNRNGCVNESYNYSTNQYLTRRCLTFPQQEFNFQSQVPVDASGCCTKFRSCANCQYDSSGMCDCSSNGFCTGINKLPCEVKNTKCFAIYKRSNSKFNKQGAVSGGSRINRLKYQTRVVAAQRRKANGRNNVINRRGPAALYTTSRPPQMNAPGCWLNKDRTRSGLVQRCIVADPCCPITSGGGGVAECWSVKYPSITALSQQFLGQISYNPMATTYSNSNCSPGSHTTTRPSLVIELSNGPTSGWVLCNQILLHPNNFIIYANSPLNPQIAGGAYAVSSGLGLIVATVRNLNPLQLILEIHSPWQGTADDFTLMLFGGFIKYDTFGEGGHGNDPPICDSDEFNIFGI